MHFNQRHIMLYQRQFTIHSTFFKKKIWQIFFRQIFFTVERLSLIHELNVECSGQDDGF